MNRIRTLIASHYSDLDNKRSSHDIQADKYLLVRYGVPFSRAYMLPAAFVMQLSIGSVYAFSIYNRPLETAISGTVTNTAATAFYIAIGMCGLTAAFYGPCLERSGPRRSGVLGALLFYAGFLLSMVAVLTKQMWLVFVGYGLVGGMGIGLAYISPIAPLEKWYPDARGFSAAMSLIGFGSGAIVASPLQTALINSVGVAYALLIQGSLYVVLMLGSAMILRFPPPGYHVHGVNEEGELARTDSLVSTIGLQVRRPSIDEILNPIPLHAVPTDYRTVKDYLHKGLVDSLKSPEYVLLYAFFFFNTIAGLVIVSRLAFTVETVFGQTQAVSSMVISVNAIFGVLARLGIGFLSDKVGRRTAFLLSCVTQLVLLIGLLVAFSTVSTWAFIILAWLISSAYGANFPLMPATLADLFSAHFVSTCHGISLTAWALASIVGGVLDNLLFTFLVPSTYLASDPGLYKVTIYWLLACQVIAIFIMTLCMRFTPQDRLYPSVPGQLFRIRLGPYLLRVTDRPRVEVVGPKQQESEWQAFLTANNLVS